MYYLDTLNRVTEYNTENVVQQFIVVKLLLFVVMNIPIFFTSLGF